MLKRIIFALFLGGLVFAGVWFFAPKESTVESLKKALADNYSAFSNIAGYMKKNPKTVVIYSKDVKNDESLKNDFDQLEEAGIFCVWNKSGAVVFDTGKESRSSDNHYLIYSPGGKPKDYPDAEETDKSDWYICF